MQNVKKLIAVMLIFVLIFCAPPKVCAEEEEFVNFTVSGKVYYDYAYEVLELLNELRLSLGKAPLKMDYTLMNDAMLRAAESGLYFSHTRPNGRGCFTAVTEPFSAVGENIAIGYTSPKAVMNGWINSPGHYSNMISDCYDTIGVGCFKTSNGCLCWAQLFNSNPANEKTAQGIEERTFDIEAKKENLGMEYKLTKIPCSLKKGDSFSFEFQNSNIEFTHAKQTVDLSSLSFVSSNEGVLEFSDNGTAVIKGTGIADITVMGKNGGGVFFNAQYDSGHLYKNACDTTCEYCSKIRTAAHSFGGGSCTEAAICTLCGELGADPTGHKYSGAGDAFCNLCNEERILVYLKGDADGDQNVTTSDLAYIKLYLAGVLTLESVSEILCDLNGDSIVNTGDLANLKLHLAGVITLEPLKSGSDY